MKRPCTLFVRYGFYQLLFTDILEVIIRQLAEKWDPIDQTGSCEIKDQGVPTGCIPNLHAFYNVLRVKFHTDIRNVAIQSDILYLAEG